MSFKTYWLAMALGLFAASARAQEFKDLALYSASDCGDDPNNLETLSTQLQVELVDGGLGSSGCMQASIDLPNWPVTDEGKYSVWVHTGDIENGCQLLFYNFLSSYEERRYCCGNDCNRDISTWKRDDEVFHRDVTEIKRAPPFSILSRRDDTCKYVKDEDAYTTYGQQIMNVAETECPIDSTNCGAAIHYSTGFEITNGWNIQVSVSAEIFGVVSFGLSGGYEHSESESREFSVDVFAPIEDGHKGRGYFQPLYVCE
ncbi:hypothetical protein DL764_004631 [Monosporascus ibericus]|uniref:Uncharacterized protein n=1 Tax=Monosporascus ibericus TaxID=155417 RepID=A0A4Q4TEP0_9PEZI|nr:hypothetical protein DL764_004631 [Monosporascus ibericus]